MYVLEKTIHILSLVYPLSFESSICLLLQGFMQLKDTLDVIVASVKSNPEFPVDDFSKCGRGGF